MLAIYRLFALLIHLLYGLLLATYLSGLLRKDFRSPIYSHHIQKWLARVVHILGVRIEVTGQLVDTPALLVSNHISWLDIALLGAVVNPRFLSKDEIRQWPVIGWLAKCAGTLFIKRGEQTAALGARIALMEGLKAGDKVLIFPEATTGEGGCVKRFHPRLYSAAIDTESMIQPIAIAYKHADGSLNNIVPYVGKQNIIMNLMATIKQQGAVAEVHILSPIKAAKQSRRALAEANQLAVTQKLNTIFSPSLSIPVKI